MLRIGLDDPSGVLRSTISPSDSTTRSSAISLTTGSEVEMKTIRHRDPSAVPSAAG
jgi:hypothetical protein